LKFHLTRSRSKKAVAIGAVSLHIGCFAKCHISKEPLAVLGERTALQSQEIESGQKVTEDSVERQKAIIDAQAAEILRLEEKYRTAKERIMELEVEAEKNSRTHEETLEKQYQRIRAMEGKLRQTKKSSTVDSKEDTGVKPLSSPSNYISDTELLAIVRDLNENMFQVAAILTGEWEKLSLESRTERPTIAGENVNTFSRSYVPTLVRQVLDRNPVAVTVLVQSCLCELVAQITSSWRHNQELKILRSVFRHLSASGEHILHMTGGI
jgi:hypothetical protein